MCIFFVTIPDMRHIFTDQYQVSGLEAFDRSTNNPGAGTPESQATAQCPDETVTDWENI
ncbi:MAG: hypothetical protein AB2L24_09140 [Mangrovibacterium sp.]